MTLQFPWNRTVSYFCLPSHGFQERKSVWNCKCSFHYIIFYMTHWAFHKNMRWQIVCRRSNCHYLIESQVIQNSPPHTEDPSGNAFVSLAAHMFFWSISSPIYWPPPVECWIFYFASFVYSEFNSNRQSGLDLSQALVGVDVFFGLIFSCQECCFWPLTLSCWFH